MSIRTVLVLLVLTGAAAVAFLLRHTPERAGGPLVAGDERPDYVMADFLLVETDEQGRSGHTLAAELMDHYAARGESDLVEPRFQFFEEDQLAWRISAVHGTVHDLEQVVRLQGDVQVHYTATDAGRNFEIRTETLAVWPTERRAETDAPVRIVQQSGVTEAIGMRARMDDGIIRLLADVRGQYVVD